MGRRPECTTGCPCTRSSRTLRARTPQRLRGPAPTSRAPVSRQPPEPDPGEPGTRKQKREAPARRDGGHLDRLAPVPDPRTQCVVACLDVERGERRDEVAAALLGDVPKDRRRRGNLDALREPALQRLQDDAV